MGAPQVVLPDKRRGSTGTFWSSVPCPSLDRTRACCSRDRHRLTPAITGTRPTISYRDCDGALASPGFFFGSHSPSNLGAAVFRGIRNDHHTLDVYRSSPGSS